MTREEALRKRQGSRLRQARAGAGYRSAREAALANEWPESTYRAHEGGTRTIGQDDAERYAKRYRAEGVQVTAQSILFDDLSPPVGSQAAGLPPTSPTRVPLEGWVSAGGTIDTSTEQREAGIEYEAQLMVNVPDATACYEVVGESMLPIYEPGSAIVCRAYTGDPEPYLGKRVVLATRDGSRHLKVIVEGTKPGRYNLESLNKTSATIRNVEVAWVARIAAIIPADEWHILEKNGGSAAFKKNNPKRTNGKSERGGVLPWEKA